MSLSQIQAGALWPTKVFHKCFYTYAHRTRLEKLLHLEPFESPNGHFKPLLDPGVGFRIETAVT